jgi:hypothetical protein
MALDQELVEDNQSDSVTKQKLQLPVDIEDKSVFIQNYVDTQSHSIQNDYQTIKPSHPPCTPDLSETCMPQITTSPPFNSKPAAVLNPAVDPFMPKNSPPKATVSHDSHSVIYSQTGQDVLENQMTEDHLGKSVMHFTKSLVEQISLNRLPPPEPGIFFGYPLKYPAWKIAFKILETK